MLARALVVGLLLNTLSCSLLVDNGADQCASDVDCARFSGTVCDLRVRLCKAKSPLDVQEDAGGGGEPVDACSTATFENACTNAACKPFNNKVRLTHLPPDGGLTPLRPREAGTVEGGKNDAATTDAARYDATKEDADLGDTGADNAWRNDASAEDAAKDSD